MYKISVDLKSCILATPQKEKDKLLLRLLAKDELLCEKLKFELLEEKSTLQLRRDELNETFLQMLTKVSSKTLGQSYYALREINSFINRHVKITKDQYGEVEMMLNVLLVFFEENSNQLAYYHSSYDAVYVFICKRTEQLLKKTRKLHSDIQLDFLSKINLLLELVHLKCTMEYAYFINLEKKFEIEYKD